MNFRKTIFYLCVAFNFIFISGVISQTLSRLAANENLFPFKTKMQLHFDSLRPLMDSVTFYSEGGEYNDYKKFMNFWEPRISVDGDFSKYEEAKYIYYTGINNISQVNGNPWFEIGPEKEPVNMSSDFAGVGPTEFITFFDNGTASSTNRMLTGSVLGGLFYSTDHGEHWNKTGTDTQWPTSGCGWAVFHPNDFQTWFASSSGDEQGESSFIGYTGGIFRTNDEGVKR